MYIDHIFQNYTKYLPGSLAYKIDTTASQFSSTGLTWYLTIFLNFYEEIHLNTSMFNSIISLFNDKTKVLTVPRMSDYIEAGFIRKATYQFDIGHWCRANTDCMGDYSECKAPCNRLKGLASKVCACKTDWFPAIDYTNNLQICRMKL